MNPAAGVTSEPLTNLAQWMLQRDLPPTLDRRFLPHEATPIIPSGTRKPLPS
jgi:hypothetical protein